ncbi:MAG: hypothetical protein FJ118_12425 [Deltaproteobacteria bacterium]|nr:hypothetical protein [Deltaproteobacteria bacterium]
MAEFQIQALVPSSGAVPSGGYDPVSLVSFTEWRLGDEAHFSLVAPENYAAGNDFFVKLEESSSASAASHTWQVRTLLMRPGLHTSHDQGETETFIEECVSAITAHELTGRTLKVTGATHPGRVSDVSISPGDLLFFTLCRVASSANEDPAAIRVFQVSIETALEEAGISECAGRVGKIIDTVRDLFNEAAGGFLSDEFILRAINRCRKDLAQEDYWRTESRVPAESGVSEVNLLAHIPEYQNIHQVSFSGQHEPMISLGSFREYEEIKSASQAKGAPQVYVVQNNILHVWPAPSETVQSGYRIYHSYEPPELTCSSLNPDPAVPRAHDSVFVYFALKQAFLRDRHAPGADVKFREYAQLYEAEKKKLLGEGDPPKLSLRSYR